ncbi:MAG: hypothetical protein NZM34_13645 [Bernardetiaceae bacterium]|nr:hypothetical protein [Bernardetiaceae bacterium]
MTIDYRQNEAAAEVFVEQTLPALNKAKEEDNVRVYTDESGFELNGKQVIPGYPYGKHLV